MPRPCSLDADAVLVRGFFLDPDVGRRGVGADLLAHVEADAARAGYDAAELVVPSAAQVLYRSLGFRPVRRLALRVDGDGLVPLLQMRKRLAVRLAVGSLSGRGDRPADRPIAEAAAIARDADDRISPAAAPLW